MSLEPGDKRFANFADGIGVESSIGGKLKDSHYEEYQKVVIGIHEICQMDFGSEDLKETRGKHKDLKNSIKNFQESLKPHLPTKGPLPEETWDKKCENDSSWGLKYANPEEIISSVAERINKLSSYESHIEHAYKNEKLEGREK